MGRELKKCLNGVRTCNMLSIERVLETCILFGGFYLEKKDEQKLFLAYFLKISQSKDETDGIQVTNVLTSVTEMLFLRSLIMLKRRYKRQMSARKNIKSKFLQRFRKMLTCM